MKRLLLATIGAYQRRVSPHLPRRCRYEPTCSAYAVESVSRFGVLRGSLLAVWRLLRCNPFSHGGFDPLPEPLHACGSARSIRSEYHRHGGVRT